MKKAITIVLFLLASTVAMAQNSSFTYFCTAGAKAATTSGLNSTNLLLSSYTYCTVTVYITNTTTKLPIFDASGNTLSNPFFASATTGQFIFYGATGSVVDVVMSGGYPAPGIVTPTPLVGIPLGGGGGGGGGVNNIFGTAPITVSNPTGNVTIGCLDCVSTTVDGTPNYFAIFTAPQTIGNGPMFVNGSAQIVTTSPFLQPTLLAPIIGSDPANISTYGIYFGNHLSNPSIVSSTRGLGIYTLGPAVEIGQGNLNFPILDVRNGVENFYGNGNGGQAPVINFIPKQISGGIDPITPAATGINFNNINLTVSGCTPSSPSAGNVTCAATGAQNVLVSGQQLTGSTFTNACLNNNWVVSATATNSFTFPSSCTGSIGAGVVSGATSISLWPDTSGIFHVGTSRVGNSGFDLFTINIAAANFNVPSVFVNGAAGSAGGIYEKFGSAPSAASGGINFYAPTSGTAYDIVWPTAHSSGSNTFLTCTAAEPSVCSWGAGGGGGGVTSVGQTMPINEFAVAGSPVTSSGTLADTWKPQAANQAILGPILSAFPYLLQETAGVAPLLAGGVAVPYTSNTTPGSTLIAVLLQYNGGSFVPSISDSLGNNWVFDSSVGPTSPQIWHVCNSIGGADTVTFVAGRTPQAMLYELQGIVPTSCSDQFGNNVSGTNSVTTAGSVSSTTEVVLGFFVAAGTGSTTQFSAGSGYTGLQNVFNNSDLVMGANTLFGEFKNSFSGLSGTQTATATPNGTGDAYSNSIITFKLSAINTLGTPIFRYIQQADLQYAIGSSTNVGALKCDGTTTVCGSDGTISVSTSGTGFVKTAPSATQTILTTAANAGLNIKSSSNATPAQLLAVSTATGSTYGDILNCNSSGGGTNGHCVIDLNWDFLSGGQEILNANGGILVAAGNGDMDILGASSASEVAAKANGTILLTGSAVIFSGAVDSGLYWQPAANTTGGSCAMSTSTSCTQTIASTYTHPICVATQQSATLTGGAVGCTVSGTTVTVTSAVANSETWGFWIFGNPS